MCTSIAYREGEVLFGRNMDLDYHFGGVISVTPRKYPLVFRNLPPIKEHFGFIGMASPLGKDFPLYCEGMNEKGLFAAGLDFVGNAHYPPTESVHGKKLSSFEFIPFILSSCASVSEARRALDGISMDDTPYSVDIPLSPLHWHIADSRESVVVEPLAEGLKLWDNPADVMTNNPTFDFHLNNLCMYMNLRASEPDGILARSGHLKTFGRGMGSVGLPGDWSPPSRFVRAAYLSASSRTEAGKSRVSQLFHVLSAVSVTRGSVISSDGKESFTEYSCVISQSDMTYYLRHYDNSRISAVRMTEEKLSGNGIKNFEPVWKEDILYL